MEKELITKEEAEKMIFDLIDGYMSDGYNYEEAKIMAKSDVMEEYRWK